MARSADKKRVRPAARGTKDRPERQIDARLVAEPVMAVSGVPVSEATWALGVSPARMSDGRVLHWHSPQPVALALIEGKRSRDRGVRAKRGIIAQLGRRANGTYGPQNSKAAVDCMANLHTAVLWSFSALESLANHAIDMLEVPIVRKGKTLADEELLWLSIEDKYKLVLPHMSGGQRVAGDAIVFGRFRRLKFLRDELVHVKRRGINSDPDEPTAYDRLMLGEADDCVEVARTVIDAAWPGFLPDHLVKALEQKAP